MKQTFLIGIILALFTVSLSAQTKTGEKQDLIQPTVYIDILRLGTGKPIYAGDSKERVWLKLVNNTKWSIFVNTFGDGKGERYIFFDVEKINETKYSNTKKPLGYKQIDARSPATELKAGDFIIFSVPQNHLAENLRIRIDFRFEWQYIEGRVDPSYSYMRGNVYLSNSDLNRFMEEK